MSRSKDGKRPEGFLVRLSDDIIDWILEQAKQDYRTPTDWVRVLIVREYEAKTGKGRGNA